MSDSEEISDDYEDIACFEDLKRNEGPTDNFQFMLMNCLQSLGVAGQFEETNEYCNIADWGRDKAGKIGQLMQLTDMFIKRSKKYRYRLENNAEEFERSKT
jgi:hypothetical protein